MVLEPTFSDPLLVLVRHSIMVLRSISHWSSRFTIALYWSLEVSAVVSENFNDPCISIPVHMSIRTTECLVDHCEVTEQRN